MSNATNTALTGLGFCHAVASIFIEQAVDNPEVRRIARRTQQSAEYAISLYPAMRPKELIALSRKMDEKLSDYHGTGNEATVHTSLALAMIDEPILRTKNRQRLFALQRVRAGLTALHDQFVAMGCIEYESYRRADEIRERWNGWQIE